MPRNLSALPDSAINLAVMLVLVAVIIHYSRLLGACALIVWGLLIWFAYERIKSRNKQFKAYCDNIIGNINDMMYYAMTRLPEGILVVDGDGRLQWCNDVMQSFSEVAFQQGMFVSEFWDGLISDKVLNLLPEGTQPAPEEGSYVISARRRREVNGAPEEFERYFWVQYRHLQANEDYPRMVVLFALEITLYEELKVEYEQSRTALIYVQVDNYDEVTQGLNETEKTALMLSVSAILEDWVAELSGLMRRVSSDMFIVILERRHLERAIAEKFTVLDKIRQLVNKEQIQVTLSMGAAVAEKHSSEQTLSELDEQAQAGLDLALGRGGDQVAVRLGEHTRFFGGRAKAVEKNTRVKARVMAKSIRDIMERCDEIFVMGHVREDYDAFGAAVGVALMAKHLNKPVHVVLSDWLDSVEKILKPFRKSEEYADMFIRENDISTSHEGGFLDSAKNFLKSLNDSEESSDPTHENKPWETMLVVVDTFIPKLVAAPSLLERVNKIVVIDHHRRSETTIKDTELIYLEPGSSSTCEMVTELLTYFDEKVYIGKLAATALYSGMVVDTKNFTVQTGARTFEAAAYLRRSGADPVAVNHLFKSDYDTTVTLAKTKAQSEFYKGGLVVSCIDNLVPNVQAIAGQAADSLLLVEGVRMTIILFMMKNGAVGISARSVGDLNVQVIMEKFGGGGHQNVAGAQVKDVDIRELKAQVVKAARAYIAESDRPIALTN